MTNDQNLIRARHAEALANDISDFITQSNSDLHQAVQAELADINTSGGASGVVLGSASSTVDGSLWLEGENYSPVVKLFSGGNVYTFQTQPDFNLVNYSTATVGATVDISNDGTYVVGSAYNDRIIVISSSNTIQGGTGTDYVSLGSSSSLNYIDLSAGMNNTVRGSAKNTTIRGGTGNDFISLGAGQAYNYIDLSAGGNNTVKSSTPSSDNTMKNTTIVGGTGNDFVSIKGHGNCIYCTAGTNVIHCEKSNNTIYSGTGNDLFIWDKITQGIDNTIFSFAEGDTLQLPESISSWEGHLYDDYIYIYYPSENSLSNIEIRNYTATQFHISAGGVDGVYTIQGSELVPAGS